MKHNDSIYHFANCRLDVGRREFYRDGVLSNLRTKSFDMLLLLIEQRDRVVSKNELLEQVWPGRYISETTLSSCLKELRKTLGDNGRQQAVIKTIHGQGFRFIATLQDSASPQAADPMAGAADTGDAPADPVAVPEPTNTGPIETGPGSEHKKVSVLHCGLVNSAALAERLGAEAMHYLLQDLFALAQEVVTRFDGQISQWLSDGLIVLFGAPVAHEDHARRALLAAFELSQRSSCLQRQPQQQQAVVSIGLSSGSAIISTLPNNPQQCYSAFNDVIRQAATLQRRADAGCVLISPDCYQLLRADVRVQALENGDGALLAECIIEPRAGVPRRFRRHMAPLVGREQELGLLQQNLAQAAEGYGQAVAISGNPGIGKSRLLSEFRHTLHTLPDTSDVRFFQANCFPHFRGTPYYPLAEYLRSCCAILDSDSADTVQQKLHNCLQAAGLQQAEALPLLLRLLDLTHDPATLEHLSAQAQRDRTALYLQQLLLHGGHTTVIALEDMHWMDASSQAWLNGFVQQLANQPVLLITTYRPGLNPDWLALPWASQLALSQLKQAHCLRLLRSLPRAITQQNRLLALAQLSGGNPFFLEELALNAGHTEHHIPDTIQGVLAARIDQLLPGDKALLQAAAIIGLSGPLQLLESLCSSPLEPALLRLQCAELLFNSFTGGERIFTFKHALVQDVAYANQLAGQRRTMHGRIARLLQQDLPELAERRPEFLAYHYSKAECYADAVRYWQRAGRKAYGRSAYQETVDHINNGLALLGHIDNPQQRYEQELALQMTLGAAQMTTCGYGATEVEHTWMRARQLCETLQNHSALFRVLIGLSNYYWVYGNFAQAYDCNRQLLRLAHRTSNAALLLRAKAAMGELLLHKGRLRLAKRYIDHCMRLVSTEQYPILSTQAPEIAATCYAAWLYWHLGQEPTALSYAEQALQRARTLSQPFTLAIALCLVAELHRFRDDPPGALELAREGADLSAAQDFPFWHGSTLVTLGWAEARTGHCEQGIATIQHGLNVFRSTGARVQLTSWLGALADAYCCAGQFQQAQTSIAEAIHWAETSGDCYYLPQLHQLQTRLAAQQDDESRCSAV